MNLKVKAQMDNIYQELRSLFEPLFHIQKLCTVEIAGKYHPHMAVKALMVKK